MSERPPLLGERRDGLLWICAYSPRPGDLICGADAVWHGVVTSPYVGEDEAAGMMSCDAHKPVMALTAEHIHQIDSPCGLPDARFDEPENRCVFLIDVTIEAPELSAVNDQ